MTPSTTQPREEAVPTEWRYSINYGPDGEENFANVYAADGQFVGNLRTHHAIAICNAFAVCEKTASASPASGGVDAVVRPLEWTCRNKAGLRSFVADSVAGVYEVFGAGAGWHTLNRATGQISQYDYEDAAKAAAQADYDQRIRSALFPAPTSGGVDAVRIDRWRGILDAAKDDGCGTVQFTIADAKTMLASLSPAPTSGGDDPKEVRDLAWKMWCEDQPGIIWTLDNKRAYRERARAALANPTPEPAGGVREAPQFDPYILKAMAENYAGGHCWDHLDGQACLEALALIESLQAQVAALSSPSAGTGEAVAGGVRVKALEWAERAADQFCRMIWQAPGIGSHYVVEERHDGHFDMWRPDVAPFGERFESKDEAKAAAQADYETRIRAALEPGPATAARGGEPSCDEQLDTAKRLAANLGYMVVPDPVHADGEVHEPEFVAQMQPSLRALGFHAVPLDGSALSPAPDAKTEG